MKHFIVLLGLIAVTACNSGPGISKPFTDMNLESEATMAKEQALDDMAAGSGEDGIDVTRSADAPESAIEGKEQIAEKIIKTGDISMSVEDYGKSASDIKLLAKKYGAMISNENETNDNWQLSNRYILRVPGKSFDGLMDAVSALALHLDHKTSQADDVTEEYVDISARLKSKKEVEKRYTQLLARANTISEILDIESHLRVIREEIESVEGRLKYLDNRSNYSTITVFVYQNLDVPFTDEPGFWSRISKGLGNGWDGLLFVFVGLANIWPFLLILLVLAWIVRRSIKKSKKKRVAAAKQKEQKEVK